MLWYNHLYLGEKAKKHCYSIIRDLRKKKYQPGIYVITPASNGNNILDIYPAMVLKAPYYEKQELLILGVAVGYQEALKLSGTIVDEMYRKTGAFCLNDFIEQTKR
jgi:hypothetical protein